MSLPVSVPSSLTGASNVRINPPAGKKVLADGLITAIHLVDLHRSHGHSLYIFVGKYVDGITTKAHERHIGKHSGETV